MKKWLVLIGLVSVLPVELRAAGDVYQTCPPTGAALTRASGQRNRLQNRMVAPRREDFDPRITLARILEPGRDCARWFNNQAVEVTGYVVGVEAAPPSSANCNRDHPIMLDSRILVALGDSPRAQQPARRFVAVVTPRWRGRLAKEGIDWSLPTLRRGLEGQWVRLQGWLYYDVDGRDQAENSAAHQPGNWRATAWELHPVTSIEVVPPPATQVVER